MDPERGARQNAGRAVHSRESLHCGYDDFFGEEEHSRGAGFWIMDRRL